MAATSVMRPRGGNQQGKHSARSVQAKRDDDVMGTNDSSIVSKRCVSKLYFPKEPDFYQPFVARDARRNPLINRGYWLRMHAVEQVVRRFLAESSEKRKVVVNLGCGYDPLPFQFWHRHSSLCEHATFVDVDYPQLVGRKRDRILTSDVLRHGFFRGSPLPSTLPVYLRSQRYVAIGCDLRDLKTLGEVLDNELDISNASVLFVSEVAITYMPVTDSDALIRWAGTLKNAHFCLLEQYLPQGPDHPFAHTMLAHFNKLQTPIHAVTQYPSLGQQVGRFTDAGWPAISIARNLWDLWSDEDFTPSDLRQFLDTVEPFDEWEEFALFGGHYFLIYASNRDPEIATKTADPNLTNGSVLANGAALSDAITLTFVRDAGDTALTPRRFGATFKLNDDAVAFHGGQGTQQRLGTVDVLACPGSDMQPQFQQPRPVPPVPPPRICHTITTLDTTDSLLVGGRTSPAHALSDCWLLRSGVWHEAQPLNPARFRHCAVNVKVPRQGKSEGGVLVFGGKSSSADVLDDWWLWTANRGWCAVPVEGTARPIKRFGATISTTDGSHKCGICLGGMSNGLILADVWEWHLSAEPELHLRFVERTNTLHHGAQDTFGRLGASLLHHGNSLLLIGGVSRKDIHGLSDDFLLISNGPTIRIDKPEVKVSGEIWPLLVGHGAVAVSKDEIVVAGGGAVCFSMGSFWNSGLLSITRLENPPTQAWTLSTLAPTDQAPMQERDQVLQHRPKAMSKRKGDVKSKPTLRLHGKSHVQANNTAGPMSTTVPRVRLQSPVDFSTLLVASKPAILEDLDMGPCMRLWTLDYLKEKISPEREVVVHDSASDHMTFQTKNFQYAKKPFGEFIDGVNRGERLYLRAVSERSPFKLPTKLEDDFPTIAQDFRLPEELGEIKEKTHSSPLRISGPVSLWLHYDVLANVLCQVRGTKTLRLYPPSDVRYLDFPPGASSSNTNVHQSTNPKVQHTRPHIATLRPGDVLFIPPMWSHTATPEEGHSVAVNVFFKNLDTGYAAGRDVYGNRDLQAYENGRRDVEKIVKAFKDVPDDIAKFYLDRLAMELQEKADKFGKK
ncbi:hypothetical protein BDV96DRAFT_564320 [Lophiotrema nucula]|uniref:tRNA wybutosine-synthesizing protein 4 n=1 Tax=Lophiotrema nucula TaxID=690887 RepID=A0A6A5ZQE7_9PLEO|nr:hypothetical protein BDV96DRAFT_564320 [Lophiotrema nucula]